MGTRRHRGRADISSAVVANFAHAAGRATPADGRPMHRARVQRLDSDFTRDAVTLVAPSLDFHPMSGLSSSAVLLKCFAYALPSSIVR